MGAPLAREDGTHNHDRHHLAALAQRLSGERDVLERLVLQHGGGASAGQKRRDRRREDQKRQEKRGGEKTKEEKGKERENEKERERHYLAPRGNDVAQGDSTIGIDRGTVLEALAAPPIIQPSEKHSTQEKGASANNETI